MNNNAMYGPTPKTTVALKVGSKFMGVGWRVSQIDTDCGAVVPVEKAGVILVPVKAVVEAFGGAVEDGCAKLGDQVLSLQAAAEENGALMVPVSAFSEAFGLLAEYYPAIPYAEGLILISNEDLSVKKGADGAINPLTVTAVCQLMARVNETREYITMEVPKAVFDLANPGPDKGRGKKESQYFGLARTVENFNLYSPPKEYFPKEGVPKGTLTKLRMEDCKAYPGVGHDVWVYIPAQYKKDGSTPANLIVYPDGNYVIDQCASMHFENFGVDVHMDVPTMLDNMIHEGKIPVTVALFVSAGTVGNGYPIWGGTDNRSTEYDSVDERFANFLVNELIPFAMGDIVLSDNIRHRVIVGSSSSATAALGAAWHKDFFGTVLTSYGSFAHMRMSSLWQFALRNLPKKDLKIFVSSGLYDHYNINWGSWPTVNRAIAESLEYSDYDYIFAMGKAGHNVMWLHYLMPDLLDWAWNDAEFSHEHVEVVMKKGSGIPGLPE